MVYDAADGYVVLFGGCGSYSCNGSYEDTWEFVGGQWSQIQSTTSPTLREESAMAYDVVDGYIVLFGGMSNYCSGAYCSDTWKFVGGQWAQLSPATSPSPREAAAITYDAADGYVVLFGGYHSYAVDYFGDTWKFLGGQWTNITPTISPSGRVGSSMTYDSADGYVVLFGGENSGGFLGDTWKFVGGQWTQLSPTTSPSTRWEASMAYDAADGYAMLFGGCFGGCGNNSAENLKDTWKFVGGQWTNITPTASPSTRYSSAITYDAADGYVVLFGGDSVGYITGDTWKFLGDQWTQLSPTASIMVARSGATMVFDAADGYVVLFGGSDGSGIGYLGDTWKFLAGQWTQISPTPSPSARGYTSMAYDGADGYVVLFGGSTTTGSGILGDTWKFLAGQWTQLSPTNSPSARSGASMVYDAADGYVVLFGGGGSSTLGDTWKFLGGQWTQLTPTAFPSAREGAAMTYDVADGYVVMFGGQSNTGYPGDTWKFAGNQWTQLSPTTSPSARAWSTMTYDAADGYVVLFGGYDSSGKSVGDTWRYVGGQWAQLLPTASPSVRDDSTMAYDETDGYLVLYGGSGCSTSSGVCGDTWRFVSGSGTTLSSVAVNPVSATVNTGGTQVFTATPTCSGGCTGVTYSWNLTNTMGTINSTTGNPVLFTAGTVPVTVALFVNATMNGTTVMSSPVLITEASGPTWVQLSPTTFPGTRDRSTMAYDAADGYVLLFGGHSLGDTWTFVGGKWTQLSPPTSPSMRQAGAMTYDAADGYVVLFGGWNNYVMGDTWKFAGGQWTQLSPTTSPSPREAAAIAYDAADGYVVLFGGSNNTNTLGDTWKFVGGQWTNITPTISPSSRSWSTMVYDAADGYSVLYGGCSIISCDSILGDTWKFLGGQWTQLSPTTSPGARTYSVMAYDATTGYVLLFGGCNGANCGNYLGDTWKFVGGQWTQLLPTTSPIARIWSTVAYDAADGYVVLFGGDGCFSGCADTWKFIGGGGGNAILSSVAVSPASATLSIGGMQSFAATPTCTATCPSGTTFSWSLTNSAKGSVNATSGSSLTFTAGSTAGTVGLFVNATLNGITKQSPVAIVTVTATGGWLLTSVAITPGTANLTSGGTQSFAASPTCSTTCNPGTTYTWTITNSAMGSLNATTGTPVIFTASGSVGTVGIIVNGTLGGLTVQSSVAIVTLTAPSSVLTSVAVSPTAPSVGVSTGTAFTATPTCSSTCPRTVTYAWALTSSTLGSLSGSGATVTFTAGTTSGAVGIFVNATLNGTVEGASTIITVTTNPITLSSVVVNPSSDTIYVGGIANFTADPGCTGGVCPVGIAYSWSLNRTLGNVNNQTGSKTTFTAGSNAGSVALSVTATLNGKTVTNSATITIASTPPPTLTSVFVSPSSANLVVNGTQTFVATLACTGGTCLPGTTYFWSLTNNLGMLNSTAMNQVTFIAGSTAGTVVIFVNATLNGKTVHSSPVVVTIKALSPSSRGGFLGLPGNLGYILVLTVVLVAVAVLVVAALIYRRSGRNAMARGLTTSERTTPRLPPQSEYKVSPKTPSHPPSGDGASEVLDPNDPLNGLV